MEHTYKFGQRVICDGDQINPMVVVGILYRQEGATEFECAYWFNGDHKTVWLPSWRLTPKPEF